MNLRYLIRWRGKTDKNSDIALLRQREKQFLRLLTENIEDNLNSRYSRKLDSFEGFSIESSQTSLDKSCQIVLVVSIRRVQLETSTCFVVTWTFSLRLLRPSP